MAAVLGIQVGVVQVRAQQREQRPVTLGEAWTGPAEKEQPHGPATAHVRARWRQGQHQIVLKPLRPVDFAVRAVKQVLTVGSGYGAATRLASGCIDGI